MGQITGTGDKKDPEHTKIMLSLPQWQEGEHEHLVQEHQHLTQTWRYIFTLTDKCTVRAASTAFFSQQQEVGRCMNNCLEYYLGVPR